LNCLINAYQQGIFPWYGENEPVLWYAPNPRMIMTPEALHISKSLNKVVRSLNAHFPLDNQSTHSPYFVPNTQRLFLRHY
jgi:Leu/Phe-tRNA-protein transferase